MALALHPSRELRRRQLGLVSRHAAAWNRRTSGNLEKEYNIKFPQETLAELEDVSDLIALVEELSE